MNMGYRMYFGAVAGCLLLLGQVYATGKITKLQVSGGTAQLTIESSDAERYQVQCCSNLISGVWVDVGASFLELTNSTTRAFDASAPRCYFRVVKVAPVSAPPPPPPLG